MDTGGELAAVGFAPSVSLDEFQRILLEETSYRVAVQPTSLDVVEWVIDACANELGYKILWGGFLCSLYDQTPFYKFL